MQLVRFASDTSRFEGKARCFKITIGLLVVSWNRGTDANTSQYHSRNDLLSNYDLIWWPLYIAAPDI